MTIPDDVMNVDLLAQEIRRVDGNHDKGASALAEALMPFIARAIMAERERCAKVAEDGAGRGVMAGVLRKAIAAAIRRAE